MPGGLSNPTGGGGSSSPLWAVVQPLDRQGLLSFADYDGIFACATAAAFDEAGKQTKAADTMCEMDLGRVEADVKAGGIVSLALLFAMKRRLLARGVFTQIRARVVVGWPLAF